MAQHYRRKQIRHNIAMMYLDNLKSSKTYTDQMKLEGYMTAVTQADREAEIRHQKERAEEEQRKQLDLFR